METVVAILGATGILSAVVGGFVRLAFNRIEKKIDAERSEREKREAERKEYELCLLEMTTASAALGKANAVALRNGHTNGETKAALEYLDDVKHKQRDFLTRKGIDHLF